MLWCPVRKVWLVAQPEEFVRQALIAYLLERGASLQLMQVERKVGHTNDRLDLLLLSPDGRARVLAEAKAPGYPLQPAIDQLARYNRHWQAPYTLAVNGSQALCCHIDYDNQRVRQLDALPTF